jgi:hypothetical protein
VYAIYGSASGLTTAGNLFIHQDTTGFVDAAEPDDAFGSALTAGDFNIDTRVNLAVGIPGEDIGNVNLAGAVSVINGSASGLTQLGDQFFSQDSSGVLDAAEPEDGFGSAVAAGNFNGQGGPDLAVGVSFEDVGSINAAGAVSVIYSSPSGLSATGNQFFHQNATGILDTAELFDRFGSAVATGDFNGDNRADLAVGAFGEDVGNRGLAGAVHVIYGSTGVLTTAGNQFLHQDTAGIADAAEIGDRFGSALATGTFNDGAQTDLAIGVPEEHIGLVQNAGALNAIYGSASGLTATGDQFFSQNTSGVPDSAEQDDNFGAAVASR